MAGKAVSSLGTGLEDPEKVTVAFLVADSVQLWERMDDKGAATLSY